MKIFITIQNKIIHNINTPLRIETKNMNDTLQYKIEKIKKMLVQYLPDNSPESKKKSEEIIRRINQYSKNKLQ